MDASASFVMAEVVKLLWTEWLMVAVFVGGVVTWGFLMRKASGTMEGSFLAGRKVPGIIASLSTVATNLNANDFIGGAGVTYAVGVLMSHGKWINGSALILVALLIMPKLRRLNVYTLGEWLERRYDRPVGVAYSVIWSFVWMLFNLGLYLYAGALVLETLVGWDLETSILVLSAVAAVYTLVGGFGAVVATDVLQISLMFFPFIFVAYAVLTDIGGVAELAAKLPESKGTFWPGETRFGPLHIMLFGMFCMGSSYWTSEAQVVQRPLAARSEEDSTISYLGATFWLSILFPILVTLPALAAIHYFPNLENPDHAMPELIRKFLPRGLYGVTVVGLVAGVFSSADSQINAFCTMFTTDIYKRTLRPNRSEKHYLRVSKIGGVIFTFAAIGTALLVSQAKEGMMLFAIGVLATIMPPFAAVTALGAVWKRMNSIGAMTGLLAGGMAAVSLLLLGETGHLNRIADDHLFFRAGVTSIVTVGYTILVSFRTPPEEYTVDRPEVDISHKLSPRVWRFVILLVLGIGGMTAFWSYHFTGQGGG